MWNERKVIQFIGAFLGASRQICDLFFVHIRPHLCPHPSTFYVVPQLCVGYPFVPVSYGLLGVKTYVVLIAAYLELRPMLSSSLHLHVWCTTGTTQKFYQWCLNNWLNWCYMNEFPHQAVFLFRNTLSPTHPPNPTHTSSVSSHQWTYTNFTCHNQQPWPHRHGENCR
jgi:hypothetical protein